MSLRTGNENLFLLFAGLTYDICSIPITMMGLIDNLFSGIDFADKVIYPLICKGRKMEKKKIISMEVAKKKLKVEETKEKPAKYKKSEMKKEAASTSVSVSSLDRMVHAWASHFTLGISPASLMLAYLDWLVHLTFSIGTYVLQE